MLHCALMKHLAIALVTYQNDNNGFYPTSNT